MKYEEIRDQLKTGDVVLFSGKGFFSRAIKLFSHSKWSHVGIVVKIEDFDLVLLWESTGLSKVEDIIDGKRKKGVQTVALSDRLETYKGDISVRQLNGVVAQDGMDKLRDLRKLLKNRPYEKGHSELVRSLVDIGGPLCENAEDLSSVFCSELVAESLQEMGVIDERLPSNEFIPKNFAKGGRVEHYLTPGFSYGDEIKLK